MGGDPWVVLVGVLITRARVATAQGEHEQGERDIDEALASVPAGFPYIGIPDPLECLATVVGDSGSHREATRLFGAAAAIRQRTGVARFKVWDADYDASLKIGPKNARALYCRVQPVSAPP